MNDRIFWICAMECICAQTRPWSILSSKRVLGNGVRTNVNCKGKIPSTGGTEQGGTCDGVSHRTVSPTHCQLNYSGHLIHWFRYCIEWMVCLFVCLFVVYFIPSALCVFQARKKADFNRVLCGGRFDFMSKWYWFTYCHQWNGNQ